MSWPKILLLVLALTGVSCQYTDTDKNRGRAAALLNPRREASLAFWKDKTLHGRPALDFTPFLTAVVLPPNVRTSYHMTKLPGGETQFDMVMVTKGGFYAGSAVPITRDGYFLTAAHVVDSGPGCTILTLSSDEKMNALPARVVWRGGNSKNEPDLALIHARVTPHTTISMAPMEALRRKQPVLTSGVGSNGFPKLAQGESGGRLVAMSNIKTKPDGEKWLRFSHTAPLAPGDSGGPVIGEDGKLIGINTGLYGAAIFPLGLNQIWLYRGTGEAADPAWIQSLIEADRAQRKAEKKSRKA